MTQKKNRRAARAAECLLLAVAVGLAGVLLRAGMTRYARAAYPDTYRDTVYEAAAAWDVAPSLVFAVIRTESGFRPEVVSTAGAVGLMQVTESTLDWAMMRTGGDRSLTAEDLRQPECNIAVGTCVLSLLMEMFENEDTVLAAYNAGMGNVREWLSDTRYSTDGVALYAIPFSETEQYVQRVRQAQEIYQKLYHME